MSLSSQEGSVPRQSVSPQESSRPAVRLSFKTVSRVPTCDGNSLSPQKRGPWDAVASPKKSGSGVNSSDQGSPKERAESPKVVPQSAESGPDEQPEGKKNIGEESGRNSRCEEVLKASSDQEEGNKVSKEEEDKKSTKSERHRSVSERRSKSRSVRRVEAKHSSGEESCLSDLERQMLELKKADKAPQKKDTSDKRQKRASDKDSKTRKVAKDSRRYAKEARRPVSPRRVSRSASRGRWRSYSYSRSPSRGYRSRRRSRSRTPRRHQRSGSGRDRSSSRRHRRDYREGRRRSRDRKRKRHRRSESERAPRKKRRDDSSSVRNASPSKDVPHSSKSSKAYNGKSDSSAPRDDDNIFELAPSPEEKSAATPDLDTKLGESRIVLKPLGETASKQSSASGSDDELSGVPTPVVTGAPAAKPMMIGNVTLDALQEQIKKERIRLREFIVKAKEEHEEREEQAREKAKGEQEQSTGTYDPDLRDDWDDNQGYYRVSIGEVLDGRYLVISNAGKGVFSNVVKCLDQKKNIYVAVKIIRTNGMMRQAAKKEVEFLLRLNKGDEDGKRHIIKMLGTFEYRNHLCMSFELMWNNLRHALKLYGAGKGLSMGAVWSYSRQIFTSLYYMKKFGLIHADIKPDNILISKDHKVLKMADLGSATKVNECDITSYFVSRFYRPPEIILGLPYGTPIDMWAVGCTLYEIFVGKILFPGYSNNDMLRHFMEVKGKIPHKMIKQGQYGFKHFNKEYAFLWNARDAQKQEKIKVITDLKPTRDIQKMLCSRVPADDPYKLKKARQLADLIGKCLVFDPSKRIEPEEVFHHPWIADGYQSSYNHAASKSQ